MTVELHRPRPSSVLPVFVLAFCLGCDRGTSWTQRIPRQELPSIRTEAGIAARSLLSLPSGPCVVLHYPPTDAEDVDLGETWPVSMEDGLEVDSNFALLPYSHFTTFNCVTFALADLLQLGPNDWVEPEQRDATFFINATELALQSCCELVTCSDLVDIQSENWAFERDLQHGDIVCYTKADGREKDREAASKIVHMGRVQVVEGKVQLLSKLGSGPIVGSTIEYLSRSFDCNGISVYRPK